MPSTALSGFKNKHISDRCTVTLTAQGATAARSVIGRGTSAADVTLVLATRCFLERLRPYRLWLNTPNACDQKTRMAEGQIVNHDLK